MSDYSHDWLCRQIVDGVQDAIIFADREGIIRLWNSGAEAIFGYSEIEAIGQDIEIIIPEKLIERHRQGYRKVMETGDSKYGRELLGVPALRKDGARISIEFSIVILKTRGSSGRISGGYPRCDSQVGAGKSTEGGAKITCRSRLSRPGNRSGQQGAGQSPTSFRRS